MARYFTLEEAEKLLPEVESSIREAMFLKSEFAEADQMFRSSVSRVSMLGGVDLNRTAILEQRARREVSAMRLKEVMGRIEAIGCLVKDLDIGLIDFPTLFRGSEVYLCWKLGEQHISFWHKVEDGFKGRQAIDNDFMENHKGEAEN